MNAAGPPSLAPTGTPPTVAHYLDNAAACLRPYIQDFGLELKAYEVVDAERGTWVHHLYGSVANARFAIQVAVNDDDAPLFVGTVAGFVEIFDQGGNADWLKISWRKASGMHGMLEAVDETFQLLRLGCGFHAAQARFGPLRA